jgi:tRNA(Leu) C34 or U34 (ribose-2'-O)-methylase TrmL
MQLALYQPDIPQNTGTIPVAGANSDGAAGATLGSTANRKVYAKGQMRYKVGHDERSDHCLAKR